MLWERAPNSTKSAETGTSAEGLSKELLRRVCEPFFEQMLTTLLGVLQGQNPYGSPCSEKEAFEACFQPQHSSQVDRLSEEQDGSNPDDLGAFSSVLVDSNFGQPSGIVSAFQPEQASDAAKVSPGAKPKDQDKSATVIVCRHWKSKGWCRMAENCKFAHPDHKCGVGAPNGAKGSDRPSEANVLAGEHARSEGPGNKHASSSSDEETGANGAGQKKAARKRRSKAKGKQAAQPSGDQTAMVPPGILHASGALN